ncbi:MAG: response regulator transcription factor [Bacillales bacterium]|jgi:DNA-binding response OmpR family regulator|nr:response regulator transcription factor [Bacillales bacterium]
MTKILLVEDEKVMAKNIAFFLENESYSVEIAYDGETAIEAFNSKYYDLILLDWTIPKKDGLEVCKEIRKSSNIPIIMLTAKGEIFDKVIGLEVGADDYLVKPFHQRELLARIHAVLRRNQQVSSENIIQYNSLQLDKSKVMLRYYDKTLNLTTTEFKILDILIRNPKNVFSREFLFTEIYGVTMNYNDRTIDVNISRLRKKITELTGKRYLKSIRGLGYKFVVEE